MCKSYFDKIKQAKLTYPEDKYDLIFDESGSIVAVAERKK